MRLCVLAVLLCGCGPGNYKVLSFFFDGVPPPVIKEAGPAKGLDSGGGGGVKTKKSSVHGPYAAKLCNACHNVSGGGFSGMTLVLPKEELCHKCHVLDTSARYVHGPIAAGGCLVCHDPHSSANRFLLKSDAETFCFYCHVPKDVERNKVHENLQVTCTECHNPHVSNKRYLLR